MATENEYVDNLFREIEIFQKIEMPNENENNNQKLLVALFQEIETELSDCFFCRMKVASQVMRQIAQYSS